MTSHRRAHRGAAVDRRRFLRSGVSAGAVGLSLADLLHARSQETAVGLPSKSDTAVIQVWLGGGPSQFETYDPKPQALAELRGPFSPIATSIPGIQFCEVLPRQARLLDKVAILRSVRHNNGDHHAGMHWCITGHNANGVGNFAPTHPAIGAVAARVRGARRPGMPPYVHLGFKSGNPVYDANHHAAHLGARYNPFRVTDDPSGAAFRLDDLQIAGGLDIDRLDDRRGLLARFDRIRRDVDAGGQLRSLDQFQQAALDLLTGPAAREAFDLTQEAPHLRDRYGRNRWGQSVLLARRLVERGVTFVTVNTDPHSFTWDMHGSSNDLGITRGMQTFGPMIDDAVATLIEDLHDRGLNRQVLVLVWGEFGRTPQINKNGGRDHWGELMSVLLSGGDLAMGQVIGSSDAKGAVPQERPLWPQEVIATVYRHLGIDRSQSFLNTAGRPIPILNEGEPIRELIGG